jgi:hypothetical protein
MFKTKGLSFVLVFFVVLGFLNLAVADNVDVTGIGKVPGTVIMDLVEASMSILFNQGPS